MTEGHRVTEDWMGTPVETLEDLLRPGLRAVCIGINPAPDSVAAEHYFVDILLGWIYALVAFWTVKRLAELLAERRLRQARSGRAFT